MSDIRAVEDAVHVLTRPRQVMVQGHLVSQAALLTRLMQAIRSDAGRTHGGAALPSERNALDLGAFHLYEDISGRIASMLETATEMPADRDPRINLDRWFDAFELAWFRNQITYEAQLVNAHEQLIKFAKRIESHFDPATAGELIGACPNCGETRWYSDSRGSQTTALYTLRREGVVEAHCHWCDEKWVGLAGLSSLGMMMADTPNPSEHLTTAD